MIVSNKALDIVNDLKDELWYEFHGGNINTNDEFYDYIHQSIDSSVIYNYDCEDILKGNMDYCFDEHDLYGKPENINQAAYALLYDLFIEEDGFSLWNEMEEVLSEK